MRRKWGIACLFLLCAIALASTAYACDHKFGPYKTKRSATCRQAGLEFRYCTKCDHWEKREIPKLPHTLEEWTVTVEPTCTKRGAQEARCTVCGDLVRHFIDMLPHTYGEMQVVREPSCTAEGRGEYVCEDCGKKKSEKIEKLGHDWAVTKATKEPTCKSAGSGEQQCQRCGRTRTATLERLEHVWGEWTVVREPDGKKKGLRESVCTLCGAQRSEQFFPEGTLYQDMEPCEEVIRLQEMLRDLGYYDGNIRSGQFGAMTGKAVSRFQKKHGLRETEVADEQTRALIEEEWARVMGAEAGSAVNE